VDIAVEHNIIQKSGSWFNYGESRLGQGRDAVKQLLLDNPELTEELEEKIKSAATDTPLETEHPSEEQPEGSLA